ncbi:hypothetical protein A2833_00090 [Candidatus Azambacteria bacterium RIFCSPHIGHO2_01_FULL_44_55]|uniref:Uncharacterized protein n=1 Tax=Candidatus Azambacteria bacterium RIFCSPLOWO2_02_FULL_44_14 TaxID=1797306 RepID=A0A1F5CBN9_9BACT|nr:MAG: hypothetical protein A3A18_01405 [Candidatus Azambacteria bacterium RIFCSPLOWO2_01_FULL_44_84]OGD33184.1 MAG: hypothetical protein A3C78_02905 [Candidatus Azambacteria bacterium RIFCSPHIGHO2_02_FULL_45_18]OGD40256.1 MAG: hypothetical protein A2833_00090 [Candidatus Azambacteria bacterium RIFCSPHIGHO2_01_FULL_44_55]OGD40289.1 MAG: hypothetical protein A3I30_03265 [Candidatus Azambacteria bacterium RIFCSPLOWO2_02_FULL_44_14]
MEYGWLGRVERLCADDGGTTQASRPTAERQDTSREHHWPERGRRTGISHRGPIQSAIYLYLVPIAAASAADKESRSRNTGSGLVVVTPRGTPPRH